MAEAPEFKEELINFILGRKHCRSPVDPPVYANALAVLSPALPSGLQDVLDTYSIEMTREEGSAFLVLLNPLVKAIESAELRDVVFGMINISQVLTRLLKDKTEMMLFPDVCEVYTEQFKANKGLLKEFNSCKKDQGNLSIDAPSKNVVTRFPPEPSGYLHIGHAKAALLNWYFSSKAGGRMLVRFDDTNPEKEKQEFEEGILEDLALLNITEYSLSHSSDHFEKIIELGFLLIGKGKAYADNTPQERMREERGDGIASRCRDTDAETNRRIFQEMIEGRGEGYCLRAKIDMSSCNKAMRDPVVFRTNLTPHHRTGMRYRVYPTYDFTCPIVDSLEGVTLSLRTNEYRDRNEQYYWFVDSLGLENRPQIHDFSRLNFENTVLSKRKLKFYVENGFVSGWDDPRLATIRGIRRLGMNMEALREYILMQGVSQKTSTISWDKVWALNKKKVDPCAARYSCVRQTNAVETHVNGAEETVAQIPRHKKNAVLGTKAVLYSSLILLSQEDAGILEEGEEFTLMNWGNAVVRKKEMAGGAVTRMELDLHLAGDFKATKNKISWISKRGAVLVELVEYGTLMNDGDTEDLALRFNRDSMQREFWFAEQAAMDAREGDVIQFERIGFYYCDGSAVFNLQPFTRQKRTG